MTLAVLLFSIFVARYKVDTFNNPTTYFSLWWGCWTLLSCFGLFNLDSPSIRTYFVINTCMAMFATGCILVIKKSKNTYLYKGSLKNTNNKIQIILLLVLLYFVYRTFYVITFYHISVQEFRGYAFISTSDFDPLFGSNQIRLIFSIIVPPLVLANVLIELSYYFLNIDRKTRSRSFHLSIVNLILYNAIMMGRIEVFRFILFFVLCSLVVKGIKKHKKIKNMKTKAGLLTMIIVFFTYIRMNDTESLIVYLFRSIVVYFTGSFIALDQFLNSYYISHPFSYKYGGAFFGGLQELFILVVRRFDKGAVSVNLELSSYADKAINIGGQQNYNAFYTMIYNFYADGGLIAAIILSLILGVVVGVSYNYFKRKTSAFSLSLYIYLIHISIFASLRWELSGTWAWFVIICLYYLEGRNLKKGLTTIEL